MLSYLLTDAAPTLVATSHGIQEALPAHTSLIDEFLVSLADQHGQDKDFQVFVDALNYIDIPSHEAEMPNSGVARDRINAFWGAIIGDENLDVDAATNQLETDLQGIFEEAH